VNLCVISRVSRKSDRKVVGPTATKPLRSIRIAANSMTAARPPSSSTGRGVPPRWPPFAEPGEVHALPVSNRPHFSGFGEAAGSLHAAPHSRAHRGAAVARGAVTCGHTMDRGVPRASAGNEDRVTAQPPRTEDVFRHLEDLRTDTYEGAHDWPDRVAVFRRAVELLDPLVKRVLDETNAALLDGTGTVQQHVGEDADGGVYAHWYLSWPAQRTATARDGAHVQPIQVIATFARGTTHPHWTGTTAGMWPCQVIDEVDAARQEPIIRAIAEAEHQRIFDGTWRVVPAFARRDTGATKP
jgi:hypothetical protein